jgi:hypothetical protein
MLTTVKNNDQKEKRNSALKCQKKNYRKYKKKFRKKKAATLLVRKGNVNTPFTQKIQAKF